MQHSSFLDGLQYRLALKTKSIKILKLIRHGGLVVRIPLLGVWRTTWRAPTRQGTGVRSSTWKLGTEFVTCNLIVIWNTDHRRWLKDVSSLEGTTLKKVLKLWPVKFFQISKSVKAQPCLNKVRCVTKWHTSLKWSSILDQPNNVIIYAWPLRKICLGLWRSDLKLS